MLSLQPQFARLVNIINNWEWSHDFKNKDNKKSKIFIKN